jgi:hypothetical protein
MKKRGIDAMWTDVKTIYRESWRFALSFPLLFLIPVLVEMAQHVVELQASMYFDLAGAKAAEGDPLRLWFGFAKTLAIGLPGYWFVRYLLLGDPARAVRIEWPAIGLFALVFAFAGAQSWWALFGPNLLAPLGLEGLAVDITSGVAQQVMMIYLTAWAVAWALGNARIGPLRSVAIMRGSFWYAIALLVAGFLPLMVPHYGLAIAAMKWAPVWLDWVLMIIDSLVVGFLALTMAGSAALAAGHAARRTDIDLAPPTENQFFRDAKIPLGSASK